MSTKTLRKRVALIAVSAMGFGLLTGVSTPANAAAPWAADLSLNSTYSSGVLASSIKDGLDGTATLLTTGTLALNVDSSTSVSKVVVSSGAYISRDALVGVTTNETISADQLSATGKGDAIGIIAIRPSASAVAGSTFTVTSYASTADGTAANNIVTVTIASSSVSGTVVAANSFVSWVNYDGAVATLDSSTASETTTGLKLYANIQLNDAYKADITSTTGSLIVTASTGANVAIGAAASAVNATGTYSTAVSSASPANINVVVSEATAGAGWSGTLTVTYNGVAIATKTGKISGNAATLTIAANAIGKTNTIVNAKAFTYVAKDSAGNTLLLPYSDVKFNASSNTAVVSAADGTVTPTSSDTGYGSFTCGAAGSADLSVKTTLSTGTVIKSNTVKVLCGGAADNFSVALDKSKYAQGDVAVALVTFKDIKGNLANSYDSVTSVAGSAKDSISFPMAKQIGASNTTTGYELADANGQVKFKFNVGDVSSFAAGKFSAVFSIAYPTNASAQTVAYEVTGAGGVSNSDILASIVKLITAINKQIAALQKLLLKK